MSHYLNHMAALAVNQVPLIQPRLTNRFEGSASAEPVDAFQEVAQETYGRENKSSVNVSTERIDKKSRNDDAASQNGFDDGIARSARPQSTRASEPESSIESLEKRPMAHVPTTQLPSTKLPESILLVAPSSNKSDIDPLFPAQPLQSDNGLVTPKETIIEKVNTQTHEHFFEKTISKEISEKIIEREIATPDLSKLKKSQQDNNPLPLAARQPIQTRMVAPGFPSPRQEQSTESKVAAPTIQVSIGRIEIRANPAPVKQTARPQTKSSTLSLDDYLKQRKEDR